MFDPFVFSQPYGLLKKNKKLFHGSEINKRIKEKKLLYLSSDDFFFLFSYYNY